jgi:hypothetical protein
LRADEQLAPQTQKDRRDLLRARQVAAIERLERVRASVIYSSADELVLAAGKVMIDRTTGRPGQFQHLIE